LVLKVKDLMKSNIKLNFGKLPYRNWEQMISKVKLDKSLKDFKFTSIDEWLQKTIDYFKSLQ
jgi:hypothetical protein